MFSEIVAAPRAASVTFRVISCVVALCSSTAVAIVVEISLIVLLITGWFVLPGTPLFWTTTVLLAVAAPWLFSVLLSVLRPPRDQSWLAYYAAVGRDAGVSSQQWALSVTFLPHQAVVSADAIIRTLIRLFVTKRHLLEWQTASQVERSMASGSRLEVWRRMWPVTHMSSLLVVVLLAIIAVTGAAPTPTVGVAATLPLVILWLISPAIAHSLSELGLSLPPVGEHIIVESDRQEVRRPTVACLTGKDLMDFVHDPESIE